MSANTLKVRAITRIADATLEPTMLSYADGATADVLERIVRDTADCRDAAAGPAADRSRRVGVRRIGQQGGVVEYRVRLLPEDAATFDTMLDRLVELDEAAEHLRLWPRPRS